jgi:hypothetical protein
MCLIAGIQWAGRGDLPEGNVSRDPLCRLSEYDSTGPPDALHRNVVPLFVETNPGTLGAC